MGFVRLFAYLCYKFSETSSVKLNSLKHVFESDRRYHQILSLTWSFKNIELWMGDMHMTFLLYCIEVQAVQI